MNNNKRYFGKTSSGKKIYFNMDIKYNHNIPYNKTEDCNVDYSWQDHVEASNIFSSICHELWKEGYLSKVENEKSVKARDLFQKAKNNQIAHDNLAKKKFKMINPNYHISKFDKEHLGYIIKGR